MIRCNTCENEARYHILCTDMPPELWTENPVYCGICDIEKNGGKGKLKGELKMKPDWTTKAAIAIVEYLKQNKDRPFREGLTLQYVAGYIRTYHEKVAVKGGECGSPFDRERVKEELRDEKKGELLADVADLLLTVSRKSLRLGKYTNRFADLTSDQLNGLLWLVGEFSSRAVPDEFKVEEQVGGMRRWAAALNAMASFGNRPLGLEEVRALMRQAAFEPSRCRRCGAPYDPTGSCSRRHEGCQGGRGDGP